MKANTTYFNKSAFNRTIVELKFLRASSLVIFICSFNRTIVELKFHRAHILDNIQNPFNRTIVELKYQQDLLFGIAGHIF